MSKIYTKTGDQGSTSLLGGTRISKSHIQLEAYGTTDELNAHIGIVIACIKKQSCIDFLHLIQHQLFIIGSLLAVDADSKKTFQLPMIELLHVKKIEQEIDALNASLPVLKNFILPAGSLAVAHIHLARCVCRRAERNCVTLREQNIPVEANVIMYLNRLSDYLFILARYIMQEEQIKEVIWEAKCNS